MSRKHNLKINRALNEKTLIENYKEKISIKNKNTELFHFEEFTVKAYHTKPL